MKIHYLVLAICFISACNSQSRLIKYRGHFAEEGSVKLSKKVYYLEIPKGGKVDKRPTLTGDYHNELRISFPDSSIIYITNNVWLGSSLNYANRMSDGDSGYTKEHLNDSIWSDGTQIDGKYWCEHVLGNIVVGYINVRAEKKERYDNYLKTIRTKR